MDMTWQAWAVLVVLFCMLVALFLEKGPPDQLMLGALALLWNMGIVSTSEALRGFGNPGLVTVGALFVVVQAVDKARVVERGARRILGHDTTERMALMRLCLVTYVLSALFNNTPLVVLFMPIVRDWAQQRHLAPSKFLIPLSYSSIMGGMLTTIGTSTNLLVNGLLEQQGLEEFAFFAPGWVSLPVGLVALALMILVGPLILPSNKVDTFGQFHEEGDNLVAAFEVTSESRLIGRPVSEFLAGCGAQLAHLLKIRRQAGTVVGAASVTEWTPNSITRNPSFSPITPLKTPVEDGDDVEVADGIRREGASGLVRRPNASPTQRETATNDSNPGVQLRDQLRCLDVEVLTHRGAEEGVVEIFPVPPEEKVRQGDVLLLSLPRDTLVRVTSKQVRGVKAWRSHAPSAMGSSSEFVELVLGPLSPLIGQPVELGEKLVSSTYHVGLVAVRCRARPRTRTLTRMDCAHATPGGSAEVQDAAVFRAGDVLMVLAPSGTTFPKADFLLIVNVAEMPPPPALLDMVPLLLFLTGLGLTVSGIVPMVQVAVTLSVVFVLAGWVKATEVAKIVDWRLLTLIGSALGLSTAMQKSGLASSLAKLILEAGLPKALVPTGLFFTVMCITELVTNNAAAALGVPLAIGLAEKMSLVSPRPLVMVVMLGASTSFASPIGYATNLMVMDAGGYSFLHFLRVGAPMDLVWVLGVSLLLPLAYPLL